MGMKKLLIIAFATVLAAACSKDEGGARPGFDIYGKPDGTATTVSASTVVDEGTLVCVIGASSAQVTAGVPFTMQMRVTGGTAPYQDVYGSFTSGIQTVQAQFPVGTTGSVQVEFRVTDAANNFGFCRAVFQVL